MDTCSSVNVLTTNDNETDVPPTLVHTDNTNDDEIDEPLSVNNDHDEQEPSLSESSGESDIDEIILSLDDNKQTKLFSTCPLSIYEASISIIKLCRRLNLNKAGIKTSLHGFREILPMANKLPLTVPGLMKIAGMDCSKKVTYYCRECLHRLNAPMQSEYSNLCSLNNQRRPFMNVSELVINDIHYEIRTTAERYMDLINEYPQRAKDLLPCDIINGTVYKKLTENNLKQLTIMLHTDGAPLTTVGGKSLWPVQATLVEIPPPIRDHIGAIMVFGAWLGGRHPDRDLLWGGIVQQIKQMVHNGIRIKIDDTVHERFSVRVQWATFDLPALALNCNITQFNGYDACADCKVHGVAIGKQIYYPYSAQPSPPKTDNDYVILGRTTNSPKSALHGVKGSTPLTEILLLPTQIPKDYMHLVCAGHFKTLINYWNNLFIPDVFDHGSRFLLTVILPHSFNYQFLPLT
ncbi:unnamed protein product, partial [Didymodactylos carnosus]